MKFYLKIEKKKEESNEQPRESRRMDLIKRKVECNQLEIRKKPELISKPNSESLRKPINQIMQKQKAQIHKLMNDDR